MATVSGAHMILYSENADADRAFLRDVLGFPHVDVGQGWLIFALPASEIAIHPAQKSGEHEIYLMVDDVAAFVARMNDRGILLHAAAGSRAGGCSHNCHCPAEVSSGSMNLVTRGRSGRSLARPQAEGAKPRKRRPAKRRVAAKAAKPARRARRRTKR